jgi:hypothetical protein
MLDLITHNPPVALYPFRQVPYGATAALSHVSLASATWPVALLHSVLGSCRLMPPRVVLGCEPHA